LLRIRVGVTPAEILSLEFIIARAVLINRFK